MRIFTELLCLRKLVRTQLLVRWSELGLVDWSSNFIVCLWRECVFVFQVKIMTLWFCSVFTWSSYLFLTCSGVMRRPNSFSSIRKLFGSQETTFITDAASSVTRTTSDLSRQDDFIPLTASSSESDDEEAQIRQDRRFSFREQDYISLWMKVVYREVGKYIGDTNSS